MILHPLEETLFGEESGYKKSKFEFAFDCLCLQNTDTNNAITAQKLADLNEAGFIIGGSLALRM